MSLPPEESVCVARFNHDSRTQVPIDPDHYQIYTDLYTIYLNHILTTLSIITHS